MNKPKSYMSVAKDFGLPVNISVADHARVVAMLLPPAEAVDTAVASNCSMMHINS